MLDDEKERANLVRELERRFAAIPSVVSVGSSAFPLLSGAMMTMPAYCTADVEASQVSVFRAGPRFFETMGLPVVAGRAFQPQDFAQPDVPRIALVNEAFVRARCKGHEVVGRRIGLGSGKAPVDTEIIGVVKDAKYETLRDAVSPTIYRPILAGTTFQVRTAGNPRAVTPAMRDVVAEVSPESVVVAAKTQIEHINEGIYQERILAFLAAVLAVVSLFLACIGLYGLLSYDVSRRTREIGVRVALGAQARDIMALVLRRGLVLAAAGAVVGLSAALGATRFLRSMLYGVSPADPPTFAAVALLMLAVALVACSVPARRAVRCDPVRALRHE